MSLKIILEGIFIMFAAFMLTGLVILGALPPDWFIWSMLSISIISGFTLLLVAVTTRGILEPFMSARMKGKDLLAVITATKRIEFLSGWEEGGVLDTKRGGFMIQPDSVYGWPNGVLGGIAFYKYGSTLNPNFIKATTKLREKGIEDIEQLEKAVVAARAAGFKEKDLVIELK